MRPPRYVAPGPRPDAETSNATTTAILTLVASGTARTRASLARTLGVSASTVTLKVGQLMAAGLIEEGGWDAPSGGRPARLLTAVPRAGTLLTASLGRGHARLGAFDLQGSLLTTTEVDVDLRDPPEVVLIRLVQGWGELVGDFARANLRGVGLSLPAPVDPDRCAAVQSAKMPDWNGWRIAPWFRRELGLPVVVDNDANLSALGEYTVRRARGDLPSSATLLHVKAGSGLGGGLVVEGRVHRGATWLGGDIAHVRVPGASPYPCACGNVGCLETVVGGLALVQGVARSVDAVRSTSDLIEAAEKGVPEAVAALRSAGGTLGQTLSTLVNFINPQLVTIGGSLARSAALLAQVQAKLYESCHPLATQDLRILESVAGPDAEIIGVAQLLLRRAISTRR